MRVKRSSILLMVIIFLFSATIFPQAYNSPESAVYDATNDRYLISNLDGNIISVPRINPGDLSFFSTGSCSSVRGLIIVGNTLYGACTANDGATQVVIAFDISTGNVINTIPITTAGETFINDITVDPSGILYLSGNLHIYMVDPVAGTFTIFLANAGANGLLYEAGNNRLLYTDDTPQGSSQISAIDMTNNVSTPLITNPNFQFLDGLTQDQHGNYYVSCWSNPNGIYKYNQDFTNSNNLVYFNEANAGYADIFYDQINDVLVVPKMSLDAVDFIQPNNLVKTADDKSTPTQFKLYQNHPNPFNPNTSINYEVTIESMVNISVYDLLGAEIIQIVNQIEQPGIKTIKWDGRDANGNSVNGGVYVYRLTSGNYTETKKMVLLK